MLFFKLDLSNFEEDGSGIREVLEDNLSECLLERDRFREGDLCLAWLTVEFSTLGTDEEGARRFFFSLFPERQMYDALEGLGK